MTRNNVKVAVRREMKEYLVEMETLKEMQASYDDYTVRHGIVKLNVNTSTIEEDNREAC